ncbi:hypothetical protein M758_1G090600, partial [Ceratodon purpureus]
MSSSDDDSSRLHLSGKIDGSDSAVSGLVYLTKQAMIHLEARPSEGNSACKFIISINKKAFDSCALYLGNSDRKPLGRAIQSVFEWLRPELSAESISAYGLVGSQNQLSDVLAIAGEKHDPQHDSFDPTSLYEAVMPSRAQPEMNMDFPELIPELRPYQRRAAYWMVQREKDPVVIDNSLDDLGSTSTSGVKATRRVEHPLWVPVDSLNGQSRFFFNPYSGYVSMNPHDFQAYVRGGILADEMGLGKTVEVLACILAHRASKELTSKVMDSANRARERVMKYKRDRVECSCGATEEDDFYKGSWVQCDHCDAWQHALCVGYATPVDMDANLRRIAAQAQQVKKDEKTLLAKRVREVHAMPVSIVTKDNVGSRANNVYGARVQRSDANYSVRKDNAETFVCGTCAEMIGRVEIKGECGATLVVCPAAILRQWQVEISKHLRSGTLRVLVYEGVQKGATVVSDSLENSKMEKIKVVGAHDLATADLVLTTYDTLRADVSHVATPTHRTERSFRQPKRYPVVPTPLTRLQWWRLCLDEAQMVESASTRATEMAMTLRATHRWCVTGTPIQRGLDDLYGLLRFLGAEPFDTKRWWTTVLKEPYEEGKYGAVRAMHDLFRGLMWRSTKAQVADELGLPPQDEWLAWLRFSPIEAHFYRQQHERCAVRAREVIANYRKHVSSPQFSSGKRPVARKGPDTNASAETLSPVASGVGSTLSDATNLQRVQNGDVGMKAPPAELADRLLTDKEAEKLLDQLRCLRQACVHPQVGSAGIRALQRSPMTMDEILEVLVDKTRLDAEDAQRSLFGALNGLAGLAIIENDIPLAVQIYRE